MPNHENQRVIAKDTRFSPDGSVEVLDFEQIDTAVINKVATILKSLRISEKNTKASRKKNESLLSFLDRDLSETISVGDYSDAKAFLAAVARSGASKLHLPLVYVSRSPDWSYADDMEVYRDRNCVSTLVDEQEKGIGELDMSVVRLDFDINIVGWQKDNIEVLSVLLTQWLRQPNKNHVMSYKAYLGNTFVEFLIDFAERKDTMVTSNSAGDGDDKVKSLTIPLVVYAQIGSVRFGTYETDTYVSRY